MKEPKDDEFIILGAGLTPDNHASIAGSRSSKLALWRTNADGGWWPCRVCNRRLASRAGWLQHFVDAHPKAVHVIQRAARKTREARVA